MGVIEWIDLGNVNEIVRAWPKVAREAAATMIEKYGSPNEACAGRLVWHNNGPLATYRCLQRGSCAQFSDSTSRCARRIYPLAVFDGSILVDRAKGEMSARCQGEASNFLALNLGMRSSKSKIRPGSSYGL
jgi:hypothetical protein